MSDVAKMTAEQLLDRIMYTQPPPTVTIAERGELRAELLRRLSASQAPAAPQVDVNGLKQGIISKILSCIPGSALSPSLPTIKDNLSVFVDDLLRKHLPPAAAPVGHNYSRLAEQIIAVCGTFVPGGWAHPGDKCVALIEECLRESSPQGWVRKARDIAFRKDGMGNWDCWCESCCLLRREFPAPPSAQPGEESR